LLIDSPDGSNSLQLLPTPEGNRILVTKQNQIIPVDDVIQGNWADENKVLVVFGEIKAPEFDPSNPSPNFQIQVTSDKGIYLYDLDTEEQKLIYQKEGDVPTFSAQPKDGYIIVATGFSLEKLDMDGNYLGTIYEHNNEDETVMLIKQDNVPEGSVKFNINKGTDMETKTVEI
jgi:hypothetical protein